MCFLLKLLPVLLLMCASVVGQEAPQQDPDDRWLRELLMPHGGFDEFSIAAEGLQPELAKAETVRRLVEMVRRASARDLAAGQRPDPETQAAMKLLGWVKADDAVEVIALYLKHPDVRVRGEAAENLRITQNPKAVPHLIAALLELERTLPPDIVAGKDTDDMAKDSVDALLYYFRSLSMIRSKEAMTALEESLERLRARYGNSELGSELLRRMEHSRATGGIQEYRKEKGVRPPFWEERPPSRLVLEPGARAGGADSPDAAMQAGRDSAAAAKAGESDPAVWLWIGGVLAGLAVVGLALRRRVGGGVRRG